MEPDTTYINTKRPPESPWARMPFFFGALALVLVVGLVLFFTLRAPNEMPENTETVATTTPLRDTYSTITLEAKAAYVLDAATGKMLFALHEEDQLPLASLTKVMTALVAEEHLPSAAPITITEHALASDGETGFKVGESWRLSDLLSLMLVASSNDGAAAVGDAVGNVLSRGTHPMSMVDAMNAKARELALSQTYFLNETGLDINSEQYPGAYGSAKDIAHLFAYALREVPEILEQTREMSLSAMPLSGGNILEVENTNDLAGEIPFLLAGKTGFTDNAGGNLVVAFDAGLNHPIVAVVLGSSRDGRFIDMRALVDASFEAVALNSSTE